MSYRLYIDKILDITSRQLEIKWKDNLTLVQSKGGLPRILRFFYLRTHIKVLEIVKNKITVMIKKGM